METYNLIAKVFICEAIIHKIRKPQIGELSKTSRIQRNEDYTLRSYEETVTISVRDKIFFKRLRTYEVKKN